MQTKGFMRALGLLFRTALPVAIIAAGWIAYSILAVEPEKEAAPPAEKQAVRTKAIEISRQDYTVVVQTHGVVQAHNQVTLNSQVSGQITYLSPSFESGSYFEEGEVLIEIDPQDYETALKEAEARHLGAQSALTLARLSEERYKRLVESDAVSQADVERASATRAQAEADLETALAQIERAKVNLDRTKIVAPFDGRVRLKGVGLGQSVGPATPLGEVFAVDFAEIRLPISAREVQYLELPELDEDAPLAVTLHDATNETHETIWEANIVRTEGVLDENTLEVYAIARVEDPFGRKSGAEPLRMAQPVVASIEGTVLKDVIALPRVAVRQLDQINLIHPSDFTLEPMTIESVWSDKDNVIVRAPEIEDGYLLATTHLVYAPSGTKVELIPDVAVDATTSVASTDEPSEEIASAN